MVEKTSSFGTIPDDWDESKEFAAKRRERVAMETRFVAKRIANKKLIDDDMLIYQCLENKEMWVSQKLYHLWMFLCFFASDGETDGFWRRMKDMGDHLLKEDEEAGKLSGVYNADID